MADLVDASEAGSPGWWLENLGRKLASRVREFDLLDSYYRGCPPLPEGADNALSAYQRFQQKARLNFAELIVEAVRQRMLITGFRTGADGDANGDKAARLIWDANDMDVESADVHRLMLSLGVSYAIVGKDPDLGSIITAEDPRQVVTEHDPALRRRVLAGLKVFRDEMTLTDHAYVYLPGVVWHAVKEANKLALLPSENLLFRASAWSWDSVAKLPAPVVPVVRFENSRGMGEFEPHLDHLDRINHVILQRLVIAVMQAFRQRAIQGDLPERDEAGNLIDYNAALSADAAALWKLPEGVTIWESGQVDLTPLLTSVRDDALALAAATQTPMFYFTPESTNGSAEGAALQREGLVFKSEDRIARASIGWRQVMSLAFHLEGDETRANLAGLQPMWAPPERRTMAERADAASKATDVPWRTKMTEIWQFPPDLVDRMEAERGADAFLAALAATQQQPQQPGQPVAGQPAPQQQTGAPA